MILPSLFLYPKLKVLNIRLVTMLGEYTLANGPGKLPVLQAEEEKESHGLKGVNILPLLSVFLQI